MTKTLEPTLDEIREEAAITKRILERVPADKLSWKPHPKSMSLGQLALHVASIPGGLTKLLQLDQFDVSQANFNPPPPKNVEEIHATLEQSVQAAEDYVRRHERAGGAGELASNGARETGLQQAADRRCWVDHVEPLVPPPWSTVGLPENAGGSCSGNLWPQRG